MYIAATTYAIQAGRKEEILALLRDKRAGQEGEALLMKVPGVTGFHSLVKTDADQGQMMVVYATEAQAKAGPTTPQYQTYMTFEHIAKILSCMAQGSMTRQIYEVTGHA